MFTIIELHLGTYEELLNNEGTFAEYLNQYLNNSTTDDTIEENKVDKFIPRSINRTISDSRNNTDANGSKIIQRSFSCESTDVKNSKKFIRQRSISNSIMPNESPYEPIGDINEEIETNQQVINQDDANAIIDQGETGRLIEEEEAQTGKVRYGVYLDYFRNFGWLRLCIILALIVSGEVFDTFGGFWLSHWSNFNEHHNGTEIADNLGYYLGMYLYSKSLFSAVKCEEKNELH